MRPRANLYDLCYQQCPKDKPLESYDAHAGISVVDILRHADSDGTGKSAYVCENMDAFRECVTDYRTRYAAQAGVGVDDVCWFVQLPFQVATGVPLSCSTTYVSIECIVSCFVSLMANNLFSALAIADVDAAQPQAVSSCGHPQSSPGGHRTRLLFQMV
jgi:hypothetical protein